MTKLVYPCANKWFIQTVISEFDSSAYSPNAVGKALFIAQIQVQAPSQEKLVRSMMKNVVKFKTQLDDRHEQSVGANHLLTAAYCHIKFYIH